MSAPEKPNTTPATGEAGKTIPLRDASDRSGLSVATLRKHIHEGTLAAVKTGGRYEVVVTDLDGLPAKLQQARGDREKAERDEVDARIKQIVDAAPPFTEQQKKELASIFGGARTPRVPIIPITRPVIHTRPEQPAHVHCGVCGKTWAVPVFEAHLTYTQAVNHGGKEHPDVDALLNVKPGRGWLPS